MKTGEFREIRNGAADVFFIEIQSSDTLASDRYSTPSAYFLAGTHSPGAQRVAGREVVIRGDCGPVILSGNQHLTVLH